jgi:hypothetical protein
MSSSCEVYEDGALTICKGMRHVDKTTSIFRQYGYIASMAKDYDCHLVVTGRRGTQHMQEITDFFWDIGI